MIYEQVVICKIGRKSMAYNDIEAGQTVFFREGRNEFHTYKFKEIVAFVFREPRIVIIITVTVTVPFLADTYNNAFRHFIIITKKAGGGHYHIKQVIGIEYHNERVFFFGIVVFGDMEYHIPRLPEFL